MRRREEIRRGGGEERVREEGSGDSEGRAEERMQRGDKRSESRKMNR